MDGSVGAFAGQIIRKSYTWENPTEGAEILDIKAAGGNCDSYGGCIPFFLLLGSATSFTRSTTTTIATNKSTSTAAENDCDTTTNTVTAAQGAATNTETFFENVLPAITTLVEKIGAVTDMVTLFWASLIKEVGTQLSSHCYQNLKFKLSLSLWIMIQRLSLSANTEDDDNDDDDNGADDHHHKKKHHHKDHDD
ncbi:unnamed protein product [Mucor circinelloides]